MSFNKSCPRILLIVLLAVSLAACAGTPPSGKAVLEERVPAGVGKPSSLAVWDLDDVSPLTSSQTNLGEMLSGKVIETLERKGTYTVVERQRLLLALEELHLGSSALVDESTRLRLGKLVGARLMVFGAYQVVAGKMRLDLRLVEVETGRVTKAVEKLAPGQDLGAWLEVARQAAEEL